MTGYIVHRLSQLLPVLVIASIGIWAMIYAIPGGPAAGMLGEDATPEQVAALEQKLGLDQPVFVQYWRWLVNAAQGDLGVSIQSRDPVAKLILDRIPATVQLGLSAIFVGLLIGIPVAVLSATRPGSWLDRILNWWSALALGVPTFWLGILLILLFAVQLRWLPSASRYVPIWEDPVLAIQNLLLPAFTLGVYVSGIFARFLRASLISELRSDYVRTARSKGLKEKDVVGRHVMRNALLPFITIVGLQMANFLGGTLVTEAVFTYPGLGRLLIQAIGTSDYPLIQGTILCILVFYVIINIIVDVAYAYVDPRIDYS